MIGLASSYLTVHPLLTVHATSVDPLCSQDVTKGHMKFLCWFRKLQIVDSLTLARVLCAVASSSGRERVPFRL